MEETTELEQDSKPKADLSGVPEPLHDLFTATAELGHADLLEDYRAALERVKPNADGSVIVVLEKDVDVPSEKGVSRLKLRSIRGRDYVDSRVAGVVSDGTYDGTLRFASVLATPRGVVEELADRRDLDAVYLATVVVRGNFFRPNR